MVRGLEVFRQHFAGSADHYALIGGVAVQLWFENAGLQARATKDIDMVFRVESVDVTFVSRLWAFVQQGGYEIKQRSDGSGGRELFRFLKPADTAYPHMLEVFAGKPGGIAISEGQRIVPIASNENLLSLSAILMDDAYYATITANTQTLGGLPLATPACLILLKARAWLDLSARKENGEHVDSKDIKKHRDDVFRLSQLLPADEPHALGQNLHADLQQFLASFPQESGEWPAIIASAKSAGLALPQPMELLASLREHFVRLVD